MDRSGRDVDDISCLYHLFMEEILQPGMLDCLLYFRARSGGFKAIDNRCAWLSGQNIPEFGFAEFAALMLSSIAVIGMNLYRKLGVRIDKLGQQWETLPKDGQGLFSQQRRTQLINQRP